MLRGFRAYFLAFTYESYGDCSKGKGRQDGEGDRVQTGSHFWKPKKSRLNPKKKQNFFNLKNKF